MRYLYVIDFFQSVSFDGINNLIRGEYSKSWETASEEYSIIFPNHPLLRQSPQPIALILIDQQLQRPILKHGNSPTLLDPNNIPGRGRQYDLQGHPSRPMPLREGQFVGHPRIDLLYRHAHHAGDGWQDGQEFAVVGGQDHWGVVFKGPG
jgi:hypothetical protein